MDAGNIPESNQRKAYLDHFRILATLFVVVLHASAQNWTNAGVSTLEWQTFNFFDSIARWCVPAFVMISGALFLDREIPLKKLYTKYCLRLVCAFVFWSAVYMMFTEGTLKERLLTFISGHYHMWFILMMIGLYVCTPIIKKIVSDIKIAKYYLILSFVFGFVIPETVVFLGDFAGKNVNLVAGALYSDVVGMNMQLVLGYTCYYVWGYYLSKTELSKKQRIWIYLLGLAGFAATVILDSVVALRTQQPCQNYYSLFTVNVMFETTALFTWFKYRRYGCGKKEKIFALLSKYSFGAYLVHALFLELAETKLGINTLSFNPVLSVVSISLSVCVISFIVSAIINRIPFINKYIV